MIEVQRLLTELAAAFGINRLTLIDRIQKWEREHGREASLTPEGYNNLRTRRGQQAHFLTAIILLEYLAAHSSAVRDNKKRTVFRRVRTTLLTQIRASRKSRFERSIGHDHKIDAAAIDRFRGVYAFCRVESQTGHPCQELIILSGSKGTERTRYATYVGHNLIVRGRWHLLGPTLYVEGSGYRPGHQPNFISLSLPCRDNPNVLGGVLVGLASANRDPVTLCVLAIKILDFDQSLFDIGNYSDPEILQEFCATVPRTMSEAVWRMFERVHNELAETPEYKARLVQSSWFAPRFINASEPYVSRISGMQDLSRLVMPELARFCRKKR
jgi:hypothetical protein